MPSSWLDSSRCWAQAATLGFTRKCGFGARWLSCFGRSPRLLKSFVPKSRLLSGNCRHIHFLAVSSDDFSLEGMQLESEADGRLGEEHG